MSHRLRTYLPLQRMEPLVSKVAVGSLQRQKRTARSSHQLAAFQGTSTQGPACSIQQGLLCGPHTGIHPVEPSGYKSKTEAATSRIFLKLDITATVCLFCWV